MDDNVLTELMDLERRGWDSLCDGTGDAFYGALMRADAVMVLAHGEVLDREAVIESLGQAPAWRRYEISDERLVETGGGAALVYRGTAYRDEGEPFTAWMTSVYLRREGTWSLALYQQTPTG